MRPLLWMNPKKRLALWMNVVALATQIRRGKVDDPRIVNETRGSQGEYEIRIYPNTGREMSEKESKKCVWHIRVKQTKITVHRGRSKEPRSILGVTEDAFLPMVKGTMTLVTAQMLGKLWIDKDGHGLLFFSAWLAEVKKEMERDGARGELFRRLTQALLFEP